MYIRQRRMIWRGHRFKEESERGAKRMRKRNVRGICAFLCTILLGCLIPAGEVQAQRALDVARERGYQLEERYQPAGSIITEINTAGKYDKIDDHSSGI